LAKIYKEAERHKETLPAVPLFDQREGTKRSKKK